MKDIATTTAHQQQLQTTNKSNSKINLSDYQNVLQPFVEEAAPLLKREKENEVTLSDIFRRAADELASYIKDKSQISSLLSRTWKDHDRLIRIALPAEYKRPYDQNDDMPSTEMEEAFVEAKNLLRELLDITNTIISKIRVNPQIHQKIHNGQKVSAEEQKAYDQAIKIQKQILKQFGSVSEFRRFLKDIKNMILEADLVKQKLDDRLKLDDYRRVIIRIYNLIYHFHKTGDVWHKSAKWIKHVQEDPHLTAMIHEHGKCPSCSFDFEKYFNKQSLKIKKGIEPVLPPNFLSVPNMEEK